MTVFGRAAATGNARSLKAPSATAKFSARREFPPWQPKLILFVTLIICLWLINFSLSLSLSLSLSRVASIRRRCCRVPLIPRSINTSSSLAGRPFRRTSVNLARSPRIALGSFRISFKDSTLIFCATPFQFPFTPPRR